MNAIEKRSVPSLFQRRQRATLKKHADFVFNGTLFNCHCLHTTAFGEVGGLTVTVQVQFFSAIFPSSFSLAKWKNRSYVYVPSANASKRSKSPLILIPFLYIKKTVVFRRRVADLNFNALKKCRFHETTIIDLEICSENKWPCISWDCSRKRIDASTCFSLTTRIDCVFYTVILSIFKKTVSDRVN